MIGRAILAPCYSVPRRCVVGQFLFIGEGKVSNPGVIYGTFERGEDRVPYPADGVVRRLSRIVAAGFNATRTHSVQPGSFLDIATAQALRKNVQGLQRLWLAVHGAALTRIGSQSTPAPWSVPGKLRQPEELLSFPDSTSCPKPAHEDRGAGEAD